MKHTTNVVVLLRYYFVYTCAKCWPNSLPFANGCSCADTPRANSFSLHTIRRNIIYNSSIALYQPGGNARDGETAHNGRRRRENDKSDSRAAVQRSSGSLFAEGQVKIHWSSSIRTTVTPSAVNGFESPSQNELVPIWHINSFRSNKGILFGDERQRRSKKCLFNTEIRM